MDELRDAGTPVEDSELAIEGALRPSSLAEFVGQQKVRAQLQLLIDAARMQQRPLSSGPAIQHAGDLAALLSSLTPGEVLFIDEIHRMARSAEEMLYLAMEDFRIDIMVGKGAGATSIPLDLAPFTLVGATTRSGLLPGPPSCSESASPASPAPRSPVGRGGHRASPTASCVASATT
ncbi:MAG: Holliday junction helicase RuvB [Microbacterium sp.]|nr:Holliday junction helicase RuvB [Microbacterium sp.]